MKLSNLSRNRVGPLVLSTAPIAWLGWFYLYVLRQRISLGYWPKPMRTYWQPSFDSVFPQWNYTAIQII